ncbi:hypothetical protein RJD24_10460 [Bacillaceae bacterium IKA-2]|nr:hypothetical protein RJD24_10460 [Bacillaceae bacterium IKA-2]
METENWITAHVHAFQFYGGVTRIVVPDNLKTGVIKASRTDPIINRTYQEMSEHYNTTIIPARVRYPKDKASAEGTVGHISTWSSQLFVINSFSQLRNLIKQLKRSYWSLIQNHFKKRRETGLAPLWMKKSLR